MCLPPYATKARMFNPRDDEQEEVKRNKVKDHVRDTTTVFRVIFTQHRSSSAHV